MSSHASPVAWLPVLLTALVAFGPLATDLYLPSLPELGRVFATDAATVQLTLSVFLIGFAVAQLIYGPVSDRFGRRPAILFGVTLFVAASVACALARSMEMLIAARFVQAVGACCGPVLGRAVVRDLYSRERAAKALAYMALAMALGPALGPIIGGFLTVEFGWRANFWALVAFGVAILVPCVLYLPETNQKLDPYATAPGQMMRNWSNLLSDRRFVGYLLVLSGVYSGLFAFISASSFVLIDLIGITPDAYGFCFAAVVVGYMVGTFASGRLTMRVGIDRLLAAGTAIATLAGLVMAALALAGVETLAAVVAPFFVYMIGVGLTMPNAMAGAIGPFPHMAGLASALIGFFQMAIAALVGVVVGHLTGTSTVPLAVTVVLVAACGLASFHLLVRREAPPGR